MAAQLDVLSATVKPSIQKLELGHDCLPFENWNSFLNWVIIAAMVVNTKGKTRGPIPNQPEFAHKMDTCGLGHKVTA